MKIVVDFLNGNNYWQEKVLFSAEQASNVLSDIEFIRDLAAFPAFDFTADRPTIISNKLLDTKEITICVGFYRKWLTRAIAYEQNGAVYFNVCKEGRGAGSPGNLAHEVMHALGYSHNGNSPAGNQYTVPWWVGNEVEKFLKGKV